MTNKPPVRICIKCWHSKPLETGFYRNRRGAGGYEGYCKECAKAIKRAWNRKNPDKTRAYDKRRAARKVKDIAIALDCTPNDTQSSASSNAGGAKKG
jgi:hypothetical protein